MMPDETALGKIHDAFARRFSHFGLRLPDQNVCEREKGSMPYGSSGRLYYIFGKDEGREYLEYYACHRMGDDHARIYEDGAIVDLDELSSIFCYSLGIPGDCERKEAEMQGLYRETLTDLVEKGLFEDEPVPSSLAVKSDLVLHRKDTDGSDPSA